MKTKTQKSEKRMVETWKIRMQKAGHQLAMLRTTKAVYDLVAVITNLPTMITIEYPRGNSRNRNLGTVYSPSENFTIKQEGVSKRDILDLRYYKE